MNDLPSALLSVMAKYRMTKKLDDKRRGKPYIRDILLNRKDQGELFLIKEMMHDPEYHHKYFRMAKETFEKLLHKLAPRITHKNTHLLPIGPLQRLALTIRYLASGEMQLSAAFSHRISPASVSHILRETLNAIWDLRDEYLPIPTKENWIQIAKQFEEKWQFPHCIGALDGKHVRTQCPKNTGSENFNYKGFYSNVLLALVDADYKFILVDIGAQGSQSDGGILANSEFGKALEQNLLDVPDAQPLPNTDTTVPFVILGDSGFQLKKYLMRPYLHGTSILIEKIFNLRLSRARRMSENAFGMSAARFRIFHTSIQASGLVNQITQAVVVLHNFLIVEDNSSIVTGDRLEDGVLVPGNWRQNSRGANRLMDIDPVDEDENNDQPEEIRRIFANYFLNEGAVPWQMAQATRSFV